MIVANFTDWNFGFRPNLGVQNSNLSKNCPTNLIVWKGVFLRHPQWKRGLAAPLSLKECARKSINDISSSIGSSTEKSLMISLASLWNAHKSLYFYKGVGLMINCPKMQIMRGVAKRSLLYLANKQTWEGARFEIWLVSY